MARVQKHLLVIKMLGAAVAALPAYHIAVKNAYAFVSVYAFKMLVQAQTVARAVKLSL